MSEEAPERFDPPPMGVGEYVPPPEPEAADPLPSATRPRPSEAVISLGEAGSTKRAGGSPVSVQPLSKVDLGRDVSVEVLDPSLADRAGADGFLMRITDVDEPPAAPPDRSRLASSPLEARKAVDPVGDEPVSLVVDYSSVATRFGGDYASRLQLRLLPECALAVRVPEGCDVGGVLVESENDFTESTLTARLDPDPSAKADFISGRATAQGGSLLALTSGSSGEAGSYAATPLSPSGTWEVGPASGEFTWSYPVPTQPGPAGDAPPVSLDYSSARLDGVIGGANNQAAQEGSGWSLNESFIERRYVSCDREGLAGIPDLCWRSDNAVLHLNGVSTELVKLSDTEWKARNDPNWKITRGTGAANGDNDGEFWQVLTPDGTAYQFGVGTFPAPEGSLVTDSVLTVAVWADDYLDPCGTIVWPTQLGFCSQAWRWNLDRVVDTAGNMTAYTYTRETNRYQLGFFNIDYEYGRASRIARIDYGLRAGQNVTAPSRVVFDSQYRCIYLVSACPQPTSAAHAPSYPDVPIDLLCLSGCDKRTPTFFSSKRYSAIRTQTFHGGVYQDVDVITLVHDFIQNGEDWNNDGYPESALWLRYLHRTGDGQGGPVSMPAIRFDGTLLRNRVDAAPSGGVPELKSWRLSGIWTDLGAFVSVTYGQPNPCWPIPSGTWDTNTKDCFARAWQPPDTMAGVGAFNKWLVTSVVTADTVGGSPNLQSTYTYHGSPAWHYDDDRFLVAGEDQYWSQWRGYEKATVTEGTDSVKTRTRYQMFRGMHGDKLAGGGTKTVNLTTSDGVVYPDEEWRAGRMLEQVDLANDSTSILRATRYAYTATPRGTSTVDGRVAMWAARVGTRERNVSGSTSRDKVTATVYNASLLPQDEINRGWDDITSDDSCSRTLYATPDVGSWKLDFPQQRTLLTGTTCTSGTVLRQSRWHYDNLVLGATPSRGLVTLERRAIDGSNNWADTVTVHDALGRAIQVSDPRGNVTLTGYAPGVATGSNPHPTTMTTTVLKSPLPVDAGDLVTTLQLDPERIGSPRSVTDPNGNTTTIAYDGLGRTHKVWHPGVSYLNTPSIEFGYTLTQHANGFGLAAPAQTVTAVLQKDVGSSDEIVYDFTIFDGMARPRQNSRFSSGATGSTLTQTRYDTRGNVRYQTLPEWKPIAPYQLATLDPPANDTRWLYDPLGRVTNEEFTAAGAVQWGTTTSYTVDTATVNPPVGGDVRTTFDAAGRAVAVAEQDGSAWATATYAYDQAGDLATITDPAGNTTSFGYDLAGRRRATYDPDSGLRYTDYDLNDNPTVSYDADPATPHIHTIYDALNRPIERRAGSTPGTLLASWSYDAPGEKGLLDKSVRYDPILGPITVDVAGYDNRQRPTGRTWIIPPSAIGLAGTYPITYGYDEAGHQTSVSYPAIGGLAAETVTTGYQDLTGYATTLAGSQAYVSATAYDNRGRVDTRTLGTGSTAVVRDYTYDGYQRLTGHTATRGGTVIQDDRLTIDAVGNVTSRHDARSGVNQRECFGYDQRHRLTRAFTTTATCAGPNSSGPSPYDHTYAYAVDGKITSRTEGSTTYPYTYPAQGAGSVRPHAVSSVGSSSYTYNANGNVATRPGQSGTQALSWNDEERLAAVTEPSGMTGFIYDADGARLIRQTPSTTTLYIEGHEIEVNPATTKRYYTLNGITVGVRDSSTGALTYLLGDHLGSTTVSVNASTGARTEQRYLPYGAPRSTSGPLATDRGWIGQTRDDSTGLQYLNARYYDPTVGRFTATDPLADLTKPGSLDAYGYGRGNPVTLKDPTGLFTCQDRECLDAFGGGFLQSKSPAAVPEGVPSVSATYLSRNPKPSKNSGDLARSLAQSGITGMLLSMHNDCPQVNETDCFLVTQSIPLALYELALELWEAELGAMPSNLSDWAAEFADLSAAVADFSGTASIPLGAATLTGNPWAASALGASNRLSIGASSAETFFGAIEGDKQHVKRGLFGVATQGIGIGAVVIVREVSAETVSNPIIATRVAEIVVAIYTEYAQKMAPLGQ